MHINFIQLILGCNVHHHMIRGRTIIKVKEGEGFFSLHDFFLPIACARFFFFRVKPSARIFFSKNIYLSGIY